MENLSTLFTRLVEAFELMAANQKQMADDISRQVALLEATTKQAEQTETPVEVAKEEEAPKAPARKTPARKAPARKTDFDASTPAELDLEEDEEAEEEAPKAPARKTAATRKTASRSAAETRAAVLEYKHLASAVSELHAFSDEGAAAAINILKHYKVKNAKFIPEEEWQTAIAMARNALEELIRKEEDEDDDDDVLTMDLSEEETEDDDFDFGDDDDFEDDFEDDEEE